MLYLIFLVGSAVGVYFILPYVIRKRDERRLSRKCAAQRSIVLTYDDGPGERLTSNLLDLLGRHQVRATFFVLASRLEERPEIVEQVRAAGHEIGSHSYRHLNAWKALPTKVSSDVAEGFARLELAGIRTDLFRPPHGKMTIFGWIEAVSKKMRLGWWTIDSQDSWDRREIEDVISELTTAGGGVVLMHDYDNYVSESVAIPHTDYVLSLTERIIEFAKANNFQLKTLTEL